MPRILLICLLLCACGEPTKDAVRADFLAAHPGVVVVGVYPGEGDSDHVYYAVQFRAPPDTTLQKTVLLYQRTSDGRWHFLPERVAAPKG